MDIRKLTDLTKANFRGKSRLKVNAEMSDFCKEHNIDERDVRTIFRKMHDRKKKKKVPKRKAKVRKRLENNQRILDKLKLENNND